MDPNGHTYIYMYIHIFIHISYKYTWGNPRTDLASKPCLITLDTVSPIDNLGELWPQNSLEEWQTISRNGSSRFEKNVFSMVTQVHRKH